MFRKKETAGAKVEQSVAKAVSYEITVADMARKSERRAWMVAGCSVALSIVLAGGYFYILPLKEKIPFLVMADAYTGTATVARLTGTFQGEKITTNEAVNRSNVAQYILARESYDSQLMGLRDWDLVFLMSSDPVAASYRQLYARANPANPFVMYGREKAIRVKILSLTPLDARPDGGFSGASVRIQRNLFDKRTGTSKYLDSRIITMRFTYRNDVAFSEQDRVLNPLGFQVAEYRADTDYSKGVPVPADDVEAIGAPSDQAAPAAQDSAEIPVTGGDQLPAIGAGAPQTVEPQMAESISIGTAEGASNR
ncbi:type IV secretion system protein [Xanthomonas campestris pv. campestris]|uniref:virB8 family protein n=1 Tax=Xanthomonas campestris TaxID=339 RepID=UPI001CBC67EC|nr:type IV secretion system protein [Xanthomonas campestris]MDC8745284.1 type IV secretion system protein [Xanthomonas campestris]MEA9730589.1 type IV secretion system protein [Xanthomonas campestris]UAU33229.1 type IV secretion system protein [Xanthomonas campestris pv. incanae]WDJ92503.1 type IV secretion system protein [Xanthomonas campestris pv. incanae]